MLAKVQAGWLAKAICVHSSATIASSERRVDQRWRRNRFIVEGYRNRSGDAGD